VGLAPAGAPLTIATLGAVGGDDQGIAPGLNNTVGQLGGLMMIAILPAAAGLSGHGLDGPEFAAGYETAMIVWALLSLAAVSIDRNNPPDRPEVTSGEV